MKKTLLLISTLICVLLFNACKKDPPVAKFTTEKASYKMSEVVVFVNQSLNAKDFAWDFGDGKTSTEENPSHTFSSAGTFGVTLTATGSGGTATVTDSIAIMANLTGLWYETITGAGGGMGGFGGAATGTMNVVQHDDNTLTGSFVFSDTQRKSNLLGTSKIVGNKVTIDWDSPAYKFTGTVNAAGNAISGTFSGGFGSNLKWSATKL